MMTIFAQRTRLISHFLRFENALRKQLPSATWKDAAAAAISLASEAEQILPLTPENGEMMAFLDHISKNLVSLHTASEDQN